MVKKQVVAKMPTPTAATIEQTEYLNFSDEIILHKHNHNQETTIIHNKTLLN